MSRSRTPQNLNDLLTPQELGLPTGLELPLQARLGELGHQFLIDLMRQELKRRPKNRGAWTTLSQSLSALGRHAEGCEVNERLVKLLPEHPVAHYNLACTRALIGDEAGALASLQRAVDLGFHDADFLEQDPDLVTLHDAPPFQWIVRSLREGTHRA